MRPWIEKLPLPSWLKVWAVEPVWGAIVRLSKPEVRIVTGGISFYALFSIFPIIYLTLSLLFALLPADLSQRLAGTKCSSPPLHPCRGQTLKPSGRSRRRASPCGPSWP